ncbi:MAG: hypothetical protein FGM24_04410 [Candidatus Kapabacteria bacterium]|nr:hypothetical protein [Candidatus Kapabacteria bacterium]
MRAHRTIDTVIRWVPIEPISARVRLRNTVDAATVAAADSTAGRILRERDSLGYLLASAGYHRTMTGDTVLRSGDTISIECDDLLREARLALRLARRPVAVEQVTDSIVVERHSTWPALAVTAGVGMAIAMDGVVRPAAYVGISVPIITLWP